MRILQAYKVYRPDLDGGIPEVMAQLGGLRTRSHTVDALVARLRGPKRQSVVDRMPVMATRSFGQMMSMPLAPTFPLALHRAATHYDVVALHAPFPLSDIGVSLGLPAGVALVVHWHADIIGRRLAKSVLLPFIQRTLRRADRIVISDPSIAAGSPLLEPFAGKCAVIPYGIDFDYWSSLDGRQRSEAAALRARLPRLIVAVGRLVRYKGYQVLLQAVRKVDGQLVIIGDGDEKGDLVRMMQDLGLNDRVTFAGFMERDTVKVYLHAARAFVLPSISTAEAFGIAQLEAMAAGLPVVNTRLPTAVPTIARHGSEGLTVSPGNPEELAGALTSLLNDASRAAAMADAARRRCETEYSTTAFLDRIETLYRDAVSDRARADLRP